ncbi:SDR family oxidoreductase [Pseudomonas neustonica]|uniref:SDR family oxidoreductase n=1 Tax=Pseudomonas neustonica TaxID=2487346 RepID=A0ABX9XMM4_9PSED|nr:MULTISPECIES: SDR family oxidoreductase [Pseudomonas]MBA6421157.1 SDR family oxidoreductase [Pseudomonas sp. 5Ae-yellow]ROZ83880.1 SDR family oxidoreductase [Pseudomonas sp. SSM44]ROZ85893.1 SDR family oxidoreductase [Pseudomonas neustonica]|tara:strand:+ start:1710 stop:2498 length:789 start_codon:yes stop_codon:yes gene_type:complete
MNLDLVGKRALVCGGSQGLGEACAYQLAEQGAEVVLMARSADKLQAICTRLPARHGQEHGFLAVDAYDSKALAEVVGFELEQGGAIHIWLNNTGGPAPGPANSADPQEYADAFTQHMVSAQVLLQLLLPGMREAGYGRILNVLSTSVKQPIANLGVSNTIRAAMANWAKTLAAELAIDGITVNNLLPGLTSTPRLDSLIAHSAKASGKTVEQVTQVMQASIPVGRFAAPEEFANAAGFLASPAAAYINGINLPIDGGKTGNL